MKEKIAIISILANFLLALTKITVGLFSNSAAILAAGIDSFIDIFSSLISYVGIKMSGKPEDREHPYGHYKFEVLSGIMITVIISATGLVIIYKAYQNFLNPEEINLGYLSFGVMVFSVIINEIMARIKIAYGKREKSFSLLSDGFHSKIDVYTSLVVLAGLFFVRFWIHADSILAIFMGFYIIKEAFSVGKEAVGSLLDVSAGEEKEEKIKSIVKNQNIELASLKTQKKGSIITANLEIKLPSNLKLEEATAISDKLREKLMKEIEELKYTAIQITSHEIETGFYKPEIGRGFGWERKGRFIEKIEEAKGKGPAGFCICPKCGERVIHEKGTPCSNLKCQRCNINLKRE